MNERVDVRRIAAVGVASCLGGNHAECNLGSAVLHDSLLVKRICAMSGLRMEWRASIHPGLDGVDSTVGAVCRCVTALAQELVAENQPFVFFSGDHSSAMGIWKGVTKALLPQQRCGLIWIDAHMDAHTFSTSPSGNLHGMPLAALLGQGDEVLTDLYGEGPVLRPQDVVLLGVRSYEPAEQRLLQRLGVRYFEMPKLVDSEMLKNSLQQAIALIAADTDCYGISIDLDAIDPSDAPAVGTPEPGGLSGRALCEALAELNSDSRLIGLEIAEFSPLYDKGNRTERLIGEMVCALYGELEVANSNLLAPVGSENAAIKARGTPFGRSK
ncbi:MAG: arginase [Chromatiales bacterium]|nr:arginase [Chromatiales bacterium]